jgi:predicted RNA-binding Zn-ribbon protein involved in translation (DUF1610 family)
MEHLDGSRFVCPSCGELLSLVAFVYRDTKDLGIKCTCEWCDYEGFDIRLKISKKDLKKFTDEKGLFVAQPGGSSKQE